MNPTWKSQVAFLLILFLFSCTCKQVEFTGSVYSNSGAPIVGAEVDINGKKSKTKANGVFKIQVDIDSVRFYNVSVKKFGFGLFSQVCKTAFHDKKIILTEGTIKKFSPDSAITIRDVNATNNQFQSVLLNLDTAKLFDLVPKVYDANGKLVDLGWPAGMNNLFDYVSQPPLPNPGMSVSIPANSVVTESGGTPTGRISIAVTTVDIFNPDGMPGDYSVLLSKDKEDRKQQVRLGSMDSYGAGSVELIDENNTKCKLKDGAMAEISIPVYPILTKMGTGQIPAKIPLLHFDEPSGRWIQDGEGTLNATQDFYTASVSHFSMINMDLVWTDPSCLKFRQIVGGTVSPGSFINPFKVSVIVPQTASTPFKEKLNLNKSESEDCYPYTVGANETRLHPIINLPELTNITIIFSDDTGTPVDIAIVNTGPKVAGNDSGTEAYASGGCPTPPAIIGNCDPNERDDCNTGQCTYSDPCWLSECKFFAFENTSDKMKVLAYKTATKIKVKWIYYKTEDDIDPDGNTTFEPLAYFKVTMKLAGGCGDSYSLGETQDTVCRLAGPAACSGITLQPGALYETEFTLPTTAGDYRILVFPFDDVDDNGGFTLQAGENCFTITI